MKERLLAGLVASGLGLSFAIIGGTGPATAQDSTPGPSVHDLRDLGAKIDAIVAPYVAASDFHGVVAVGRDGEPPVIVPCGLASVELAVPHKATDVFMIGSVSKQFTAAAILLLEMDGKLSTSDPVGKFLPDFAHSDKVTIGQLLTHTSGVADVYSLERFGSTRGLAGSFQQVIDDLGRMELTHAPGSAYAYSNGGYSVLAAIVENASGMAFGDFLDRRIFKPLGMSSTAHDAPGPARKNRVPGYDPWGRTGLIPALPVAPAFLMGSGSLWSSAADLLTWTSALHGGRLLNGAAYEKLVRDHGNGYGFGVSVFRRFGRDAIGHDGRVSGYASDLVHYVKDGISVAVLSNVQSVARDEIRRWVAAAIFAEAYTVPHPRTFAGRSGASLTELVGTYAFGPAFAVTISTSDGRLLARANEGGYSELVPLDDSEWFSRMLYATVRFGRDAEGSIDRLIWGRGDGAPEGRRVR